MAAALDANSTEAVELQLVLPPVPPGRVEVARQSIGSKKRAFTFTDLVRFELLIKLIDAFQ